MIKLGRKNQEEELNKGIITLGEEDIEISREDRTASGRLVRDIIAIKKRFSLSYGVLEGEDLEQLSRLYNLQVPLNLIIERESGSNDSYEVVFRPFARSNFLRTGEWYWRGISVTLEEV
ncbi:hypothetical protein [Evansella tamaricis]|uniref:Uncharacterized protein n=1 Tax=Evansella tamaricis TaxID=2069301 RepID=A0ABS6JBJ6_9BACI|nr:hypothetical protein [Evansella tamaricis]MBU9711058.1 hypothetical protein [Evansella tamaricis]